MHEMYLTSVEFIQKIKSSVNGVDGWGTVYDIDHNRLKITALAGDPFNGLVFVSPVLSTMPDDEYHTFEAELEKLSGATWMAPWVR
jgi:hypothetical protein